MKKPVGTISLLCKDTRSYNKYNVRLDWDFYKDGSSYFAILNGYFKKYTLNEAFDIIQERLKFDGQIIHKTLPKKLNRELIVLGLK